MPGWADVDDQQQTTVSYFWEPVAAHASLEAFFRERTRRHLARHSGPRLDADVRNYLERVCSMRELSRAELVEFVARHSGATVTDRVPTVPMTLTAALICRDEPTIRVVIWQAADRYWEMTWSRTGG
jgi:hypothetical protein